MGGHLRTSYDVADPQLPCCCLNTTSDGELTTSRAAHLKLVRLAVGRSLQCWSNLLLLIVFCPLKMYESPPPPPPACLVSEGGQLILPFC